MGPLYCDVCDQQASEGRTVVRWENINICTDCLALHTEMQPARWNEREKEETP